MSNKIIRTLLLADGLFLFAGGLLGPIWAIYVKEIGGDILDASAGFGTFMLSAALVTYIFSRLEDKKRHKVKFIVVGYLLGAIGFTGYLFVNNTLSLLVVQAILGLTVAIKDPAFDGIYSRFAQKHLTLAWGEWEAVDYIAIGVSAFVGGVIANFFGFKSLFLTMTAFSLAGLLTSLSLLHSKKLRNS